MEQHQKHFENNLQDIKMFKIYVSIENTAETKEDIASNIVETVKDTNNPHPV